MKKLAALLIALMLILSYTTVFAEDTVKIGMLTVLTGDRATEGEYALNAMEIALEEINGAGGVLGKPLEIVVEDALGTDVGAVNAFRKLAADPDICAIIGTNNSNDSIATSSSVLEAEVLTTAQGSNPVLMKLCNEENRWMFQLRACDITLCSALMKYAVEELGVKSFAVLHDTDSSSSNQAAQRRRGRSRRGSPWRSLRPRCSNRTCDSQSYAQSRSRGGERSRYSSCARRRSHRYPPSDRRDSP